MQNDVTLEMLEQLNTDMFIQLGASVPQAQRPSLKTTLLMKSLMGTAAPETPVEVAKLKSALVRLSPDVDRGQGKFYASSGQPAPDYWLAVIWAIASLDWVAGKDIARTWSQQCGGRYTDDGFDNAWNGFKPDHPNPLGIGSLYKRAMELGWNNQTIPQVPQNPNRYKLLGSAEIHALPMGAWRVKGVLPADGLAALFGPSASGKSFLAFDMAAAIASGDPWFGCRVASTWVIYAALEGEAGFRQRVAAWEAGHGQALPDKLKMVMQPFKLTDQQDVQDLAAVVPAGAVVFIDTLNRAAPTADENSSKEMGEILEAAKRLQALIDGLVLLVHHTGKDTTKGLRGHSSLLAALDAAIEVERSGDRRSWSVAKAKDGEDGLKFPFKLKVHDLGKDSDGDEITSCTVERDQSLIFAVAEPRGRAQKTALRLLKTRISQSSHVGKAGCGGQTKCLSVDDGNATVSASLTTYAANKRNNRARQLINDLVMGDHLLSGLDDDDEGWLWLP